MGQRIVFRVSKKVKSEIDSYGWLSGNKTEVIRQILRRHPDTSHIPGEKRGRGKSARKTERICVVLDDKEMERLKALAGERMAPSTALSNMVTNFIIEKKLLDFGRKYTVTGARKKIKELEKQNKELREKNELLDKNARYANKEAHCYFVRWQHYKKKYGEDPEIECSVPFPSSNKPSSNKKSK